MPVRLSVIQEITVPQPFSSRRRLRGIEAGHRYNCLEDKEGQSCRISSSKRPPEVAHNSNSWQTKGRRAMPWVSSAFICAIHFLTGTVYSFGEEQSTFLQYSSTWKVTPHDKTSSSSTKAPTYVSFVFRYRSQGKFLRLVSYIIFH